jgi:hypothetical protein
MADAFLRLHRHGGATTCKDHSPATRGQAEVEGKAKLSNDVLAKIVVIAMLLGALLIWSTSEALHSSQCEADCPTEFSASRR